MKFAAAALLGVVSAEHFLSEVITPEELAFMKYVTEYGKSYGTKAEFKFRLERFKETLTKIASHDENSNGSTVGLNQFSDYTEHEYKKLLGYRPRNTSNKAELLDDTKLAASVDWRTKGAVTPVKNQGQCGSCWAFSTTGSVEGAMFLKTGKLQSFSEQQLVDCSKNGNMGCNGGLMDNAFKYIEQNPLELESEYPYTAKNGKCQYVSSKGVGQVKSYKDVAPKSDGSQLMAALNIAPVSIAVEADQFVFQGYTSGIITKGCGSKLDHGVLAVGYSAPGDLPEYFIVKNSWGPSWGDKGYLKIAPDQCGITMQPSYPTE